MSANCGNCAAARSRDTDTVYCQLNPPVMVLTQEERAEAWWWPVCLRTSWCYQHKTL